MDKYEEEIKVLVTFKCAFERLSTQGSEKAHVVKKRRSTHGSSAAGTWTPVLQLTSHFSIHKFLLPEIRDNMGNPLVVALKYVHEIFAIFLPFTK